ncbi:MAG: RNA polymerase sigma factor [Bacillota bacterium]
MQFEEFFHKHVMYVYNFALRLSCDPHIAEDLTQETFMNAWRSREQLISQDAVKSWLRKICLNMFLMKNRKEKGKIELSYDELTDLEMDGKAFQAVSVEPSPEDEVIVDETIKELQNGCFLAMARKLTLNQRIVFSLIDMFGLSMDEVADILGLSKSAVKGLLYRARMSLDDFFNSRCNLVKVDNPCSCTAWIGFLEHRNNLQAGALKKKLISNLDYREINYTFDPSIRKKVQYLYKNIPDRKPSKDWYDKVLNLISSI